MAARKSRKLSRRDFVRGAGVALAAGAIPSLACGRKGKQPAPARKKLKILQWSHFIPAYDRWFDGVYEGVGREERDGGHGGPHGFHRGGRAGSRGGRGPKGTRPLPVPLAARRLRGAGARSSRRRGSRREEARQDDPARAQIHLQSAIGEVLRLLGL